MSAIKIVSFVGFACKGVFPPSLNLTTMIHRVHMQIDRNKSKCSRSLYRSLLCLHYRPEVWKGCITDLRSAKVWYMGQELMISLFCTWRLQHNIIEIHLRRSHLQELHLTCSSERTDALERSESRFTADDLKKETVSNTILWRLMYNLRAANNCSETFAAMWLYR